MDDKQKAIAQRERDDLADKAVRPVALALEAKKFDAERIACIITQAGRAKKVKHSKIKGAMTKEDLGPGYKLVATARGLMEDEHIIQYSSPDHSIATAA